MSDKFTPLDELKDMLNAAEIHSRSNGGGNEYLCKRDFMAGWTAAERVFAAKVLPDTVTITAEELRAACEPCTRRWADIVNVFFGGPQRTASTVATRKEEAHEG